MVKQTQTIRRLLPTNCLSVFNHFVGLTLKGLTTYTFTKKIYHSCLTGSKYGSAQRANTCSKLIMEAMEELPRILFLFLHS